MIMGKARKKEWQKGVTLSVQRPGLKPITFCVISQCPGGMCLRPCLERISGNVYTVHALNKPSHCTKLPFIICKFCTLSQVRCHPDLPLKNLLHMPATLVSHMLGCKLL